MRILLVSPYYKPAYSYGGPVHCLYSLSEGLAEAGAQVTVFTTNSNRPAPVDMPLCKPVNINGVVVWYFPLTLNGLRYSYSSSLAEAVRTRISEFELIYASSIWGHMLIPTAKACISGGIPYVIAVHGQLFPWALAKKSLKKSIYLKLIAKRYINRAAAIHCTDGIEAQAVMNHGFKPPTFVVPFGIDAASFSNLSSSGSLRRQLDIPDDAYVLIFLGRITHIKRPDIAVGVLGAVQSLDRDVHLVIVGPDEDGLVGNLHSQAQALGCHDKLHFTGLMEKEKVVDALLDADLLLMPSEIQENFGMAALEALATGVPILVSEGIPVGKWAQMAGAGCVVPCNENAFRQAALQLLSQPDDRALMGKRGQDLVRQRFDSRVLAREMLAQYRAIVGAGRPISGTLFAMDAI